MKGGIASGVIYPKLIARLASKYTFKNIGGTSAGAIAAGACAAAQYGRSHHHPTAFETLATLPEWLGAPATADGRSRLGARGASPRSRRSVQPRARVADVF